MVLSCTYTIYPFPTAARNARINMQQHNTTATLDSVQPAVERSSGSVTHMLSEPSEESTSIYMEGLHYWILIETGV